MTDLHRMHPDDRAYLVDHGYEVGTGGERMTKKTVNLTTYYIVDNKGTERGRGISAPGAFQDALQSGAEELRPYADTFVSLGELPAGWSVSREEA